MHGTRIRPRQVLIFIIAFVVILVIVQRIVERNCHGPEYLREIYAQEDSKKYPKIYAVTPTYARPEQKAELTRLSHLFMLVPNLHWIIVEDSDATTPLVHNLLERTGLTQRCTQLAIKTPPAFRRQPNEPYWVKPVGVEQRNLALNWIRSNVDADPPSIVYFMDDDNSYSVELFAEMSKIQPGRVGVWPVGLVGDLMVEKPLLNDDNTQVIGFNAAWKPQRAFPFDMAGFAVSTELLLKYPQARFSAEADIGEQESTILTPLTTLEQLQPLANNCRDVLVWHTRTKNTILIEEESLKKEGKPASDVGMEV